MGAAVVPMPEQDPPVPALSDPSRSPAGNNSVVAMESTPGGNGASDTGEPSVDVPTDLMKGPDVDEAGGEVPRPDAGDDTGDIRRPDAGDGTTDATEQGPYPHWFPAREATGVNPDTHLVITFGSPPTLGEAGEIRVYDADTDALVDTLDLSIPAGPHPSLSVSRREAMERAAAGLPEPTYQEMTIGGLAGFHFHPVIVRDNRATIDLHSHVLEYGHRYRVEIDASVLEHEEFEGVGLATPWTFATKASAPDAGASSVTVSADGSADFNTVQGAIDFAPSRPQSRFTVHIKNGHYEEIVYFRDKSNLTLRGENRDATVVGYGNNSSFNPSRNGRSYRPAFTVANGTDVQLSNFTINNYYIGQAEALKVSGSRNIVERMTLDGSGDALNLVGSSYFLETKLVGDGDSILSYGAAFFERCEFHSIGPLQWIRNPATRHGHVFKDCTLVGLDEPLPWSVTEDNPRGQQVDAVFARLPNNNGTNYPYAEFVLLNSRIQGIDPRGVTSVESQATFDWSNVHFWEYGSTDLDGNPLDLSRRHPIMRELTMPQDADLIDSYSNPAFVLDGWTPVIDPG